MAFVNTTVMSGRLPHQSRVRLIQACKKHVKGLSYNMTTENKVSAQIELTRKGGLPMVHIRLTSAATEELPAYELEASFCHFRRYDWAWSFCDHEAAEKGDGFASGMDYCNGCHYWLPLQGAPIDAILRTTLAAALVKFQLDLIGRIECEVAKELRWEFKRALDVAMQVAGPAFMALYTDAVADATARGNAYFGRLPLYRGGRSVSDTAVTVCGFEPEDCWLAPEYGTGVTLG